MKTKMFITLLERAYAEVTLEEAATTTVTYDPDPLNLDVPTTQCLGIVLMEPVHMAEVAVRMCKIVVDEILHGPMNGEDLEDVLDEIGEIMGSMRVLPYMSWHCAHFPGMTQEQIDADEETQEPMSAADVYAEFENLDLGAEVRWYSGRGTYGADCVAICGTNSACMSAISTVCERANEATREVLNDPKSDSMGRDIVMYWPQLRKEETEDV